MRSNVESPHATALAALALCLLTTGCALGPVAKNAAAFSQATTLVVSSSEDAFRGAVKLRHDEQVTAAVASYDTKANWNPTTEFDPLLTTDQLDARINALEALKAYALSLQQLTGKPSAADTQALQTAAAGIGANLITFTQALQTSGVAAPVPSQPVANGISTAVLALAQYLANLKVKHALPQITHDMDPNIQALCTYLTSDLTTLRRQADVDYTSLLTTQDQFIRNAKPPLPALDHQQQVASLLDLAAQQKSNDQLLAKLQASLTTLAAAHQALAAAAQSKDPQPLSDKLAALVAAGQDLAAFYQSLPTS